MSKDEAPKDESGNPPKPAQGANAVDWTKVLPIGISILAIIIAATSFLFSQAITTITRFDQKIDALDKKYASLGDIDRAVDEIISELIFPRETEVERLKIDIAGYDRNPKDDRKAEADNWRKQRIEHEKEIEKLQVIRKLFASRK